LSREASTSPGAKTILNERGGAWGVRGEESISSVVPGKGGTHEQGGMARPGAVTLKQGEKN